jgi:ABC-type transporter MlaC component
MRTTHKVCLAVLAVLLAASLATAGEPTDQVRSSVDQVIKIAQGQPDGPSRRAEIRRIANRLFDFEETAKRALGPTGSSGRLPSARSS